MTQSRPAGLRPWGDKWIGPGPIVYVHAECGGNVEQHLRCDACGSEPALADVVVRRSEAHQPAEPLPAATP